MRVCVCVMKYKVENKSEFALCYFKPLEISAGAMRQQVLVDGAGLHGVGALSISAEDKHHWL